MDLNRKIGIARTHALVDQPFFGTLLCRMPMIVKEDIPTMGTDGNNLYYNPSYVETLSVRVLLGVFVHEVCHCAFLHVTRRGTRNPYVWNQACDYVINKIIFDAGLALPEDVLYDEKYDGWTAEQVYDDLIKDTKCIDLPVAGFDIGGTGYFEDGFNSSSGKNEMENEWKTRVIGAVEAAKSRGTIPAEFEHLVADILEPEILWSEKMRQYAIDRIKNVSTWTKPLKKFISSGIYLPSVRKDHGLRELVVTIDSSGSTQSFLERFVGEINGIVMDCDIDKVIVLHVDAAVHKAETFNKEDFPFSINPVGGGGTAFEPAFEWVEMNDVNPSLFIYFTDMMGSFPEIEPDYPVLWVAYDCGRIVTSPFGDVIYVDEEI
jgi:predicted metal-dependent peptidase